ncbi:MAG: hypothetical protein MR874_04925 [Coriobacteriaceae bacterium]|nr:hypothetical protein [Coriobacteriaceae bacterium]
MTDSEFLCLAQDGDVHYLFDPVVLRGVCAFRGQVEEASMTLDVAYALSLLADLGLPGWVDDYFLGCEFVDVDDTRSARLFATETLAPLNQIPMMSEPIN